MNTTLENTKNETGNEEAIVAEVFTPTPVAEEHTQLVELKATALSHFKEEDRKEILRVADSIDVTQFDKIMSYGSIPLVKTFEQAGRVLKDFQGTSADQEVINLVVELAKKASNTQEEFNLCIQEPGFLTKCLLKLSAHLKDKNDAKAKYKAVTCYKLLVELRDSCDAWLESLADTHTKIIQSAESDRDNCYEIEEYIVAGRIAEERVTGEVQALQEEWEQTGLADVKMNYETHKRGLQNLQMQLMNLEKSRAMHIYSVAELGLELRTNENVRLAIGSQKNHSMALAAQQLRNAIFDMKNREALEGQKSITKLNDELMQKVADGVALTAEESEQILLNGVYTVEAALKAVETVKQACDSITKIRSEMVPKMEQEMDKIKALVEELDPVVKDIKTGTGIDGNPAKAINSTFSSSSSLSF